MEWWSALAIIFGGFILFLLLGVPVAFSFALVNLGGVFFLWGGEVGFQQLTLSIFDSVASWALVPVPMFMLMGEVMFRSGAASLVIDTLDKWLGRLPGRLGLLAVSGGTLFSVCSGSSMASTALLGSLLVPEMEHRGYRRPMTLGPILGSGGLAIMIPPSILAVLLATLAEISVGKTLIGGIIPGLAMAVLYASYISVRSWLQPSVAPSYEAPPTPLSEKIVSLVRYVLPLGFVVFMVLGLIFLGVASPTEASAMGAISTFIIAASYKRLSWKVVKESIFGTFQLSVMILMIFTGSVAFSQILAFSGASTGLARMVSGLLVPPIVVLIGMQVVLLALGCFMDSFSSIMITIPIFMPLVRNLGFDPIWFAVIVLLNLEMGQTTPPFGLSLFVMKGVAPPDTTMGEIYRAGLPFLACDVIVMALIVAFPITVLWLPGLML